MSPCLPDPAGPPPIEGVQHFLRLLDDINRLQKLLLEETLFLRARVKELEAGAGAGQGLSAVEPEGGRP